jgi:prolyl-tRNA synthetase
MRQSQFFVETQKRAPKDAQTASHQLLVRGDFIAQVSSGIYSFLPLGLRVYQKIENIIRDEMQKLGAQEVSLPSLIPQSLWLETKRWTTIDPPLFRVQDRHKKMFGLGPTHEEVVTDLVRKRVKSYKDLPFSVFQIQNKFRNEMRATGGLLRTREFMMKDLYSFHATEEDLKRFYEKVRKSYHRIFKRCGLLATSVEADPGTIGGKFSHEFMVVSKSGEDTVLFCTGCDFAANVEKVGQIKKCPHCKHSLEKKKSIESAHVFALGIKYSQAMGANFVDKKGASHPIIMGCYGIGLPRLMATIVEANHDERGIIWPQNVAPFQVHLLSLENIPKVKKAAERVYKDLQKANIEVLYDDREDKTPGEKFSDTDLIGIPYRIVVSERTLKKNCVEIKKRDKKRISLIHISSLKTFNFK